MIIFKQKEYADGVHARLVRHQVKNNNGEVWMDEESRKIAEKVEQKVKNKVKKTVKKTKDSAKKATEYAKKVKHMTPEQFVSGEVVGKAVPNLIEKPGSVVLTGLESSVSPALLATGHLGAWKTWQFIPSKPVAAVVGAKMDKKIPLRSRRRLLARKMRKAMQKNSKARNYIEGAVKGVVNVASGL